MGLPNIYFHPLLRTHPKGRVQGQAPYQCEEAKGQAAGVQGLDPTSTEHRESGSDPEGGTSQVRGHLHYYAITDNGPNCRSYGTQMVRLMFKWLNRRSQRRSYTWRRFNAALKWVGWPPVKIRHNLCPFRVGPE